MNCSRCGRQLTENERYVYQDKVYCENCLQDIGLSVKQCDPWATYVETSARKRRGLTGTAEMNETQKKIYDFVKGKGRATREQVMQALNLTAPQLTLQLAPLMHSELVKEQADAGHLYLIVIG